jgi:hypothetical protein
VTVTLHGRDRRRSGARRPEDRCGGARGDVLRGASGLLESGAILDIVFEDHDDYPSEVTGAWSPLGSRHATV